MPILLIGNFWKDPKLLALTNGETPSTSSPSSDVCRNRQTSASTNGNSSSQRAPCNSHPGSHGSPSNGYVALKCTACDLPTGAECVRKQSQTTTSDWGAPICAVDVVKPSTIEKGIDVISAVWWIFAIGRQLNLFSKRPQH